MYGKSAKFVKMEGAAMKKIFMGVRLKRLREERRMTQQALASALGLSLSYLNQIENNQRPLTVPVLLKLNAAFGIDVQLFSDDDEARLIADLREAMADPQISEIVSMAELRELATNMPAVGRTLVELSRRYRRALEQSAIFATQLGEDRQANAAILPSTPYEEVRDFFYTRHNYVAELDEAAERLAQSLAPDGPVSADLLARHLNSHHHITVLTDDRSASDVNRRFDPEISNAVSFARIASGTAGLSACDPDRDRRIPERAGRTRR